MDKEIMVELKKLKRYCNTCIIMILVFAAINLLINCVWIKIHNNDQENYVCEVYNNRIESSYIKYKLELSDSIDKYIQTIAPTSTLNGSKLLDVCEKYTFDIKFALAQGQIESHFGTAGMASKTNSVFNVGAFDNANYKKINGIYKYKHPDYSIEPYVRLVTERYMDENKTELDLMIKYVDKNGKRYASNPKYEEQLLGIYDKIDNIVNITKAYEQYKKYKILAQR